MRKLGKIKLNQFTKDELDRRKLNALRGGCDCARWCNCAGTGCVGPWTNAANELSPESGYGNFSY